MLIPRVEGGSPTALRLSDRTSREVDRVAAAQRDRCRTQSVTRDGSATAPAVGMTSFRRLALLLDAWSQQ
jgi:hypothetical protein